jgi:hypothetical protein
MQLMGAVVPTPAITAAARNTASSLAHVRIQISGTPVAAERGAAPPPHPQINIARSRVTLMREGEEPRFASQPSDIPQKLQAT